MKKRKFGLVFAGLICCVLTLSIVGIKTSAARDVSLYESIGSIFSRFYQTSELEGNSRSSKGEVFAYGTNATVYCADVQQAIEYYIAGGMEKEEAEKTAAEYVMEREALYAAAIQNGYSVTDKEVEAFVKELKISLENSKQYDMVKAMINQFESEDAYWEFQIEVYRKNLPIEKYAESIQAEFKNSTVLKENIDNDQLSYGELWHNYYEALKDDLVAKENYVLCGE